MNSIINTIKYLPFIYLNHNRNVIYSYYNKYFSLSNNHYYNKYTYEINKKYYEFRKKICSN